MTKTTWLIAEASGVLIVIVERIVREDGEIRVSELPLTQVAMESDGK